MIVLHERDPSTYGIFKNSSIKAFEKETSFITKYAWLKYQ